jgi:sugar lactone lactonase YvrE
VTASIIAADKVEIAVPAGDVLGETPLWCSRSGKLWWIDIDRQLHQSFDPATGAHATARYECRYLGEPGPGLRWIAHPRAGSQPFSS